MPRNSLFSSNRKLGSMFQRGRRHGNPQQRNATATRRGTFETLEARLALSANLGFAGAFSIVNGPADNVNTSSSPNDNRGGGMITDAAGNRYVAVNGAFRVAFIRHQLLQPKRGSRSGHRRERDHDDGRPGEARS